MILIDTDVLIEYLRGSSTAVTWLSSLEQETFAIPGVVAMELIMGCRNAVEVAQIKRFLAAYPIIWPEAADFTLAYELLLSYRLASGLGIPDCLIAGMAINQGACLCTFNLKHFKAIPKLDVRQPYLR